MTKSRSPADPTSIQVVVTATNFRSDRSGGQMVWKDLVDHWKASGLDVISEDQHPTSPSVRDRPLAHAFWYASTYGSLQDAVFVVDQGEGLRLILLLRKLRSRRHRLVVVVHHLRDAFRYRHPLYVRLATWNETSVLRSAHRIVVHTEDGARQVVQRGIPVDRIRVIPLGIRSPGERIPIRPLEADLPLRLLWVGGDFTRKGLYPLLEALAQVPPPRPHLTVAGKPMTKDEFSRAQEAVARLGLEAQVAFLGFVPPDQLERLWYEHDAYVLPSLHEGHGLALDEALVRGVPVLISDLPVFRERIRPDEALFVPRGDARAMTQAMIDLRDPALRRRLSAASFARAEIFPRWSETLEAYTQLIREETAVLSKAMARHA